MGVRGVGIGFSDASVRYALQCNAFAFPRKSTPSDLTCLPLYLPKQANRQMNPFLNVTNIEVYQAWDRLHALFHAGSSHISVIDSPRALGTMLLIATILPMLGLIPMILAGGFIPFRTVTRFFDEGSGPDCCFRCYCCHGQKMEVVRTRCRSGCPSWLCWVAEAAVCCGRADLWRYCCWFGVLCCDRGGRWAL